MVKFVIVSASAATVVFFVESRILLFIYMIGARVVMIKMMKKMMLE